MSVEKRSRVFSCLSYYLVFKNFFLPLTKVSFIWLLRRASNHRRAHNRQPGHKATDAPPLFSYKSKVYPFHRWYLLRFLFPNNNKKSLRKTRQLFDEAILWAASILTGCQNSLWQHVDMDDLVKRVRNQLVWLGPVKSKRIYLKKETEPASHLSI